MIFQERDMPIGNYTPPVIEPLPISVISLVEQQDTVWNRTGVELWQKPFQNVRSNCVL